MPSKTPAINSVISAIILVLALGALSFFIDLVALNGYSESAGGSALIAFGVCQSLGLILSAVFAWRLTNYFLAKFNLNKIAAIIASVLAAAILSGVLAVPAFVISMVVAEAMR